MPISGRTFRFFLNCTLSAAWIFGLGSIASSKVMSLKLSTNQKYLEQVTAPPKLPLTNKRKMFSIILGNLPDRVKVYPSENYYYFSFYENGVRYAGNIRLDASNRDKGKVNFAYFQDLREWIGNEKIQYILLDQSHGVKVKKIAELTYSVTDGSKTVIFELNDLRNVKPPKGMLQKDETLIGPMVDESGIRFFLVFNKVEKIFHYVLDETAKVPDLLVPSRITDKIVIGKRTGFAFYKDRRTDRKILIGVFEGNARVNNYFDGPFDQLPDNFIKGDALRNAIIAAAPEMAGKIDRFGGTIGGIDRYMIAPYLHYREEEDLLYFHNCTTHPNATAKLYPHCFVHIEDEPESQPPESLPPMQPAAKGDPKKPAQ